MVLIGWLLEWKRVSLPLANSQTSRKQRAVGLEAIFYGTNEEAVLGGSVVGEFDAPDEVSAEMIM